MTVPKVSSQLLLAIALWSVAFVRAGKILERGTPLVSFPTTGAIRGNDFYFIANTGIGNYTEDGKIADPAKLEPVHIAAVSLQ